MVAGLAEGRRTHVVERRDRKNLKYYLCHFFVFPLFDAPSFTNRLGTTMAVRRSLILKYFDVETSHKKKLLLSVVSKILILSSAFLLSSWLIERPAWKVDKIVCFKSACSMSDAILVANFFVMIKSQTDIFAECDVMPRILLAKIHCLWSANLICL